MICLMNMAITIKEQVPLAPLTTFQIGGSAQYFVEVYDEHTIREAIAWAQKQYVRFILLAGGSNVLVPDDGVDGLVIRLVGDVVSQSGASLICDAGCNLLDVITGAAAKRFGGWERLAGIPGTIGGAVRGNAGAFGTEIKDVTVSVQAFNIYTDSVQKFANDDCKFSYRSSFFKTHPEWIITKAFFMLEDVDPKESGDLIADTIAERERRHLQNVRAAGSFFMNPSAPEDIQRLFEKERGVSSREGRVPAGWLIEKAGMKGVCVGDAQTSTQHANYIINTGNATARDVLLLAKSVKKAVKEMFSITLEEEVYVI